MKLTKFFNADFNKSELNDKSEILFLLVTELQEGV